MTRKNFVALAAIIAAIEDEQTRKQVAEEVAAMCRRENPNFKPRRFFDAAGV